MKQKIVIKVVVFLGILLSVQNVHAQNPVNWTNDQLIEPAQLNEQLASGKALPKIICVGPGALIPNSVSVGMVKEKDNLDKLKQELKKLPKKTNIVIYCGCCPFEHCPNVRPAIDLLKQMKFTNYKLLDLPHNLKADWIDKGYPSVKG